MYPHFILNLALRPVSLNSYKFLTSVESRRLSLSVENKPKDSRETLADEMFQNVQQSYLLHGWQKWLPVPDAKWGHSFNLVSYCENRTDTSDKRLFTSGVNICGWVDKTETFS